MEEFKRYSGVILKSDNKVLMCKRSPEESLPGMWSIPSGHIEGKESPKDAALREFKEETDIKLPDNINLVGFINKYKKDGSTKKGLVYVFFHEGDREYKPNLKKAKDGHEHTECRYFTKENLPKEKNNASKRYFF
jgi:ADP-ribose pyrophosphatase YjhB (NUDIX family)